MDRETRPANHHDDWIDRLAPKAWAVIAAGTCATYGGIHAMEGNPTGCMGLADYLGWDWRSRAGIPIINVPGCPVLPDNFTETLLYMLRYAAGGAPRFHWTKHCGRWLFGETVHEGCDRGGYYEQGDFTEEYGSRKCIVKLGCWGPVVNCNVGKRGWMGGIGGLPKCRRHLHRMHNAGLSRQIHAVHESAAWVFAVISRRDNLWQCNSCFAPLHASLAEQGASLAKAHGTTWMALDSAAQTLLECRKSARPMDSGNFGRDRLRTS